MRPIPTTPPILFIITAFAFAAPAAAEAPTPAATEVAVNAPAATEVAVNAPAAPQAPAPAAAPRPAVPAASPATQPLPLADPPPAKLVPCSGAPEQPGAAAERTADDEEVATGPADVPDQPAVADEIDKESAELEDLRRAEEASKLQEKEPVAHQAGGGKIGLLPELDHDLAQLQAEYDIPIDVNEAVVEYIRFFQSEPARKHFVAWLGRSHRYIDRYRDILKDEGLPKDTVFLAMIESGFGNFAYSRAKASGPWQFIASTGKLYGLKQDFWVDERRDPEKSAHAAARFLKQLYQQTGDWRLAWAGYNAGGGRILKAKENGYDDFWDMAAAPGKKVLRAETKGYVPKLMAAAIIAKHPEAFGFRSEEIDPQRWAEYSEVTIPSATLLSVLARAAGTTERELIDLNPELRRACTPPRSYELKVPKAQAEVFAQNWPAIRGKVRMTFAGHVVRRGDTLSSIAARHGVPVQGIMEMNGLRSARKLRLGQELMIPKPIRGGEAVAVSRPVKARDGGEGAIRRSEPARRDLASSAGPMHRSRSTFRVKAGDTLWSISRRLGVELDELCRWNGIQNPQHHKLIVGAQLVVFNERG